MAITKQRFWSLPAARILLAATLLLAASEAAAQQAEDNGEETVAISAAQWRQIQADLRELKLRDQERQAWEARFSEKPNSERTTDPLSARFAESPAAESTLSNDSHACLPCESACDCDACRSALQPAPCLDCPHVSTASPFYNVRLFGAAKLDMLFNSARPVSPGVPFFLAPDSLTGLNQNTVDIHARQTTLGAALAGPTMGDFQAGGLFVGMLFNDNVIADRYGFLPLQAYGELKSPDWRFSAGLQFDVFAPGAPTVLPFSALAASGNAGNSFRGSVRVERYLIPSDQVQWTLQGALSDPITTTISPAFAINEDNGWPNVEGRVALGLGELQPAGLSAVRPFEIGLSGVIGQIRNTAPPPGGRVIADVWGTALDLRWRMNELFGVAGEVYTGRTLGTYNGAVLQTVNPETLEGVYSTGGWVEGFVYLTSQLHSHTGYAIDDPRDSDISPDAAALGRTRNVTIYSNLIWDVNAAFRVAFEAAWRETHYRSVVNPNNEGIGFQTQFQWAF